MGKKNIKCIDCNPLLLEEREEIAYLRRQVQKYQFDNLTGLKLVSILNSSNLTILSSIVHNIIILILKSNFILI